MERSPKVRKILERRPSLWIRQGSGLLLLAFLLAALAIAIAFA